MLLKGTSKNHKLYLIEVIRVVFKKLFYSFPYEGKVRKPYDI